MEINFGSALLGVIMLGLIFGPFWYIISSNNKRENKLKKVSEDLMKEYSVQFNEFEIWRDKLIAIDSKSKWFAFVCLDEKRPQKLMLDLSTITECKIHKQTKEYNGKPVIESVELHFKQFNVSNDFQKAVLYDGTYDDIMDGGYHYQLSLKWQKLISEAFNKHGVKA